MCCDSGGGAPPPPNYAPIQAASDHAANLAYQAASDDLAFRRQVYNESLPRADQLRALATQVAQQQMGIMGENRDRASQQWQRYNQAYLPNELQTVADAYGVQYMSPEQAAEISNIIGGKSGLDAQQAQARLNQLRGAAEDSAATTAAQQAMGEANKAYGMQARMLGRMGAGDPNRMAVMAASLGQNQALAKVGAANQAREAVRQRGVGLRSGVANFGRNMPNTAGQAFGLATQAGNSAVANQNAGFMAGLPYAQFAAGGYNTQLGAAGIGGQQALGMGNMLNQGYGIGVQAANADQGDGMFGALLGMGKLGLQAYSTFSDRRLKEDIELVGTTVHDLPLYKFSYKAVPGRTFVGVMADEVEKVVPEAVHYDKDGFAMVNYAKLGIRMMEVRHG